MRKREGIEPRYERVSVGADVLSITEGSIRPEFDSGKYI